VKKKEGLKPRKQIKEQTGSGEARKRHRWENVVSAQGLTGTPHTPHSGYLIFSALSLVVFWAVG
jgi:hypothetical protein